MALSVGPRGGVTFNSTVPVHSTIDVLQGHVDALQLNLRRVGNSTTTNVVTPRVLLKCNATGRLFFATEFNARPTEDGNGVAQFRSPWSNEWQSVEGCMDGATQQQLLDSVRISTVSRPDELLKSGSSIRRTYQIAPVDAYRTLEQVANERFAGYVKAHFERVGVSASDASNTQSSVFVCDVSEKTFSLHIFLRYSQDDDSSLWFAQHSISATSASSQSTLQYSLSSTIVARGHTDEHRRGECLVTYEATVSSEAPELSDHIRICGHLISSTEERAQREIDEQLMSRCLRLMAEGFRSAPSPVAMAAPRNQTAAAFAELRKRGGGPRGARQRDASPAAAAAARKAGQTTWIEEKNGEEQIGLSSAARVRLSSLTGGASPMPQSVV